MLHKWAADTLGQYRGQIRRLVRFSDTYGVNPLVPSVLLSPPTTPAIPLMWAQLEYALSPGKKSGTTVKFNTSRQLRSAASLYYAWDLHLANPGSALVGPNNRIYTAPQVSPTDELCYTIQQSGMARRMGKSSTPSWALHYQHIAFLDQQFEVSFRSAASDEVRGEMATAAFANLLFWGSWLRGGEGFGLLMNDCNLHRPGTGPQFGLPPGIGHIRLDLLPETKSSPNKVADVVIAYQFASGLCPGKWLERMYEYGCFDGHFLFSTQAKHHWDSGYFRQQYVYPLLEIMRMQGEPSLRCFTDEDGRRIRDAIYEMRSWRRGAKTFAERHHPGINIRKSTKLEREEHARWSVRYDADMDTHYREWPLLWRLFLTMLCL